MTTGTTTPQATGLPIDTTPTPIWRSCDRTPAVPMVEIPRQLAFDLIRAPSEDDFICTANDEELKQDIHSIRFESHRKHMEELASMVSYELCDSDIKPTAEVMLRTLSLIYEGAALVGKVGVR